MKIIMLTKALVSATWNRYIQEKGGKTKRCLCLEGRHGIRTHSFLSPSISLVLIQPTQFFKWMEDDFLLKKTLYTSSVVIRQTAKKNLNYGTLFEKKKEKKKRRVVLASMLALDEKHVDLLMLILRYESSHILVDLYNSLFFSFIS